MHTYTRRSARLKSWSTGISFAACGILARDSDDYKRLNTLMKERVEAVAFSGFDGEEEVEKLTKLVTEQLKLKVVDDPCKFNKRTVVVVPPGRTTGKLLHSLAKTKHIVSGEWIEASCRKAWPYLLDTSGFVASERTDAIERAEKLRSSRKGLLSGKIVQRHLVVSTECTIPDDLDKIVKANGGKWALNQLSLWKRDQRCNVIIMVPDDSYIETRKNDNIQKLVVSGATLVPWSRFRQMLLTQSLDPMFDAEPKITLGRAMAPLSVAIPTSLEDEKPPKEYNYGFNRDVVGRVGKLVSAIKVTSPLNAFTPKGIFRAPRNKNLPLVLTEVITVNVARSPERSTSNGILVDGIDRRYLGANGSLGVYTDENNRRILRYQDEHKVIQLESVVPEAQALKVVMNANVITKEGSIQTAFVYDGHNSAHSAGGTNIKGAKDAESTVSKRRFTFWLDDIPDLNFVVHAMFQEDMELTKEFFAGGFTREETKPDHVNVGDASNHLPVNRSLYTTEEEEDELGYNPGAQSQY